MSPKGKDNKITPADPAYNVYNYSTCCTLVPHFRIIVNHIFDDCNSGTWFGSDSAS